MCISIETGSRECEGCGGARNETMGDDVVEVGSECAGGGSKQQWLQSTGYNLKGEDGSTCVARDGVCSCITFLHPRLRAKVGGTTGHRGGGAAC
jgi:hypothetical protein